MTLKIALELTPLPVFCAEVFEARAVPGYQLCADYIKKIMHLCVANLLD